MRSTFSIVSRFTGANNLSEYGFDFKIEALEHLLVIILDDDGEEVARFRGDDDGDTLDYLDSVEFDAENGGGTVFLEANLPTDYEILMILANDEPVQSRSYRTQFSFTLKGFEMALDYVIGAVQRATWLAGRSLRLHDSYEADFDPQLPAGVLTPNASIVIDDDGLALALGPTAAELAAALAAAAAALVSETNAAASAAAAGTAETNAETAETNAETAETNAEAAYVAAQAAADTAAAIAAGFSGFLSSGPFTVVNGFPQALAGEVYSSASYRQIDFRGSMFAGTTVASLVEFSIFFRDSAWELVMAGERYSDSAVASSVTFTVNAATGQITAENIGVDDVEISFKKTAWAA